MSLTKYASLEVSDILDIKGSRNRAKTASLNKLGEFEDYRTEDGFLYARIRAISSRVNKNHDGWPSIELAGSQDIFDRHHSSEGGFVIEANKDADYGYSTFLGKPIFVDHNNSNPKRARGVIVDAKLHIEDVKTASSLDPYYASAPDNHKPPTWVELLLEVDAKSFPKLAKAIIEGAKDPSRGIDGFSMGCDVEKSICNICKNAATAPDEYCQHVKLKGATFDFIEPDGRKTSKAAYEDCYGIRFFEISAVFDPADETALLREVRSSVEKEAAIIGLPCQDCKGRGFFPNDRPCNRCGGSTIEPGTEQEVPTGHPGSDPSVLSGGHILGPEVQPYGGDIPNHILRGPKDKPLNNAMYSNVHTADNPPPQSDLIHAPEPVDTLREEHTCPVCGSTMEDETCEICGFIEPPEGFENPDLSKAKETDLEVEQNSDLGQDTTELSGPGENPMVGQDHATPRNEQAIARVTGDMAWKERIDSRVAGRINPIERPILSGNPSQTNEPQETVLSDQNQPVTSRTASEYLAAVRNKETNTTMATRIAAEPVPGAEAQSGKTVDHDHTRVDVTGVGGVQDASNEQASKADAQVDVEGIGSAGVTDVAADKTENVEQGDEYSKNVEAIPTKTFPDRDQHDPVTSDPFPDGGEGVKSSGWKVQALDADAYPTDDNGGGDDGGLSDGGAVKGVQPIDPVGRPDQRVNVKEPVSSPSNNSGPTKTWTGTEGNGVLKQQDPTTNEVYTPFTSHLVTAMKLADLEIELGLERGDTKYARIAALEETHPTVVAATLSTLQRVKTAGLYRPAQRVAHRMPSMTQPPTTKEASERPDEDPLKGTLFGL